MGGCIISSTLLRPEKVDFVAGLNQVLKFQPAGFWHCVGSLAMNVGPCHHGMARPQVADAGTVSNMEGSCE